MEMNLVPYKSQGENAGGKVAGGNLNTGGNSVTGFAFGPK